MKNTLYLDLGDGYMGVYIYKNQSCCAYIPTLCNYLRFFLIGRKGTEKVIVLVIYFCETNYHKLNDLNIPHLSQFCGQDPGTA